MCIKMDEWDARDRLYSLTCACLLSFQGELLLTWAEFGYLTASTSVFSECASTLGQGHSLLSTKDYELVTYN